MVNDVAECETSGCGPVDFTQDIERLDSEIDYAHRRIRVVEESATPKSWTWFSLTCAAVVAFAVAYSLDFAFDRLAHLENHPAISRQDHATELSPPSREIVHISPQNSMAASTTQMPASLPPSIRHAVFRVRTADGSGSGVAVHQHLIITARHVVEGASPQVVIDIYNEYGTWRSINGTVIALDDEADLALIRVSDDLPAVAVLGLDEARNASPGDPLVCVGSTAGGTAWNSTAGYLSAKGAPEIDNTYWQMSTPIFYGNSGGAVYETRSWKLVGISVAMNSFCSTFFIPVHTVQAFLKRAAESHAGVSAPKPVTGGVSAREPQPCPAIKPFIRREK